MLSYSVIVPCFNCVNTIERCVDSIFEQAQRPKEVFLIDDGSVDKTFEALVALQRKYPECLVFKNDNNRGVSAARNVGLRSVTSDLVAFLDSDDYWLPEKMEFVLPLFVGRSGGQIVCHRFSKYVDQEADSNFYGISFLSKKGLFFRNCICTSSVVLTNPVPYIFDESLAVCEDLDLWFKLIDYGYSVQYSKKRLVVRRHAGLSKNLLGMHLGTLSVLRRQHKNLSWFEMPILLCAMIFEVFKFAYRFFRVRLDYICPAKSKT